MAPSQKNTVGGFNRGASLIVMGPERISQWTLEARRRLQEFCVAVAPQILWGTEAEVFDSGHSLQKYTGGGHECENKGVAAIACASAIIYLANDN